MNSEKSGGAFRKSLRILRPLGWWLLLVLLLFSVRLHEQWMRDTCITFELRTQSNAPDLPQATLDGKAVISGQNISLGRHIFSASSAKNETFQVSFFAGYGPHSLGLINLKRSTGTLIIVANPIVPKIEIAGTDYSTTLYDCLNTNLIVPSDTYTVRADYAHWSQLEAPIVTANQMAVARFAPRLGALTITCDKEEADYSINLLNNQTVANGILPATINGLPGGEYLVRVNYRQSVFETNAIIVPNTTNDVNAVFSSTIPITKPVNLEQQSIRLPAPHEPDVAVVPQKADGSTEVLNSPHQFFETLCATNPAAASFEEHELKTRKPAKQVEEAILDALKSDPDAFGTFSENSPSADIYQVTAKRESSLGILGGNQRLCLLTVGRTKDEETEILFKVLELQIHHKLVPEGFAMHDERSLVPISQNMALSNPALQMRLQKGVQSVTGKIQKAIESLP